MPYIVVKKSSSDGVRRVQYLENTRRDRSGRNRRWSYCKTSALNIEDLHEAELLSQWHGGSVVFVDKDEADG